MDVYLDGLVGFRENRRVARKGYLASMPRLQCFCKAATVLESFEPFAEVGAFPSHCLDAHGAGR